MDRSVSLIWHAEVMAAAGDLTERWANWVGELADHPLDQYEYLGLLQHRDAVATWLEVLSDSRATECVDEVDADFEALTVEDSRYAERFSAHAGPGWWWQRVPADSKALSYLTQDW